MAVVISSDDRKEITIVALNTQLAPRTVEFALPVTVASAKAQSPSEMAGMMKYTEVILTADKKKVKVAIDRYSITSVHIDFKKNNKTVINL